MNTRSPLSSSSAARRLLSLLTTAASLASAPTLFAQSTWSGAGGDANWSTAANWNVSIADSFSTALVFAGSTQLTNTNDLTGGTATSLAFSSGAGTYTLGGNALTLGGGITNSSTNL